MLVVPLQVLKTTSHNIIYLPEFNIVRGVEADGGFFKCEEIEAVQTRQTGSILCVRPLWTSHNGSTSLVQKHVWQKTYFR